MVFRLSSQLRGTLIVYGTADDEMSEISDSKSRPHCEARQKESHEAGDHARCVGRPGDYHHNKETTSNNFSPERPLRLLISQKGRKQYSQQSATETWEGAAGSSGWKSYSHLIKIPCASTGRIQSINMSSTQMYADGDESTRMATPGFAQFQNAPVGGGNIRLYPQLNWSAAVRKQSATTHFYLFIKEGCCTQRQLA